MKQTACPELSRMFPLLACHSARSTVDGRPALELGGAGLGCRRGALAAALDDDVELVAVLREALVRAAARAVDDLLDLAVDQLGDVLRVVPLLLDLPAQEDELVGLAVLERPELLAHAVLRHHMASHLGGLLDVVRGAG